MRKIIFTDVFAIARILKKTNSKTAITQIIKMRENYREAIAEAKTEEEKKAIKLSSGEKIGEVIIDTVINAITSPEFEKDIIALIASISEKSTDEIANMPIEDIMSLFNEFNKNNNLKLFFEQALKLI